MWLYKGSSLLLESADSHDDCRNMTKRGASTSACPNPTRGDTLVYDAENRLTSITTSNGTRTYVYDGDGNRVKKTEGSDITRYWGNLYEVKGSEVTKYYYMGRSSGRNVERDDPELYPRRPPGFDECDNKCEQFGHLHERAMVQAVWGE